jgi:hypothetical protein
VTFLSLDQVYNLKGQSCKYLCENAPLKYWHYTEIVVNVLQYHEQLYTVLCKILLWTSFIFAIKSPESDSIANLIGNLFSPPRKPDLQPFSETQCCQQAEFKVSKHQSGAGCAVFNFLQNQIKKLCSISVPGP